MNPSLTINVNTIGVWYIHLPQGADWVCVANREEENVVLLFSVQSGSADRVSLLETEEALNRTVVPGDDEEAIKIARKACENLAKEEGLLWWELLGRPGDPENRRKIIEELRHQDWFPSVS